MKKKRSSRTEAGHKAAKTRMIDNQTLALHSKRLMQKNKRAYQALAK
ncbi:hypothetical protein ACKQTC_08745 [Peptococcus simiae]|uniref:Uncharacterized protein n=1 Tax=Peptococcus simiae TaxID=1643805 RepID=A0ABW9H1Y5_9FIRM